MKDKLIYQFFKLFVTDKHTLKCASVIYNDIDFSHPYDTYDSIVEHELFEELNDKDETKTRNFLNLIS